MTEQVVNANVLQDMKVLLAKEQFALTIAMIVEHVGQRNTWLPKLLVFTILHGTQ